MSSYIISPEASQDLNERPFSLLVTPLPQSSINTLDFQVN